MSIIICIRKPICILDFLLGLSFLACKYHLQDQQNGYHRKTRPTIYQFENKKPSTPLW